jgi:hypothetical protein
MGQKDKMKKEMEQRHVLARVNRRDPLGETPQCDRRLGGLG